MPEKLNPIEQNTEMRDKSMTETEKDILIETVNRLEERFVNYPSSYTDEDRSKAVNEVIQAAKALPLHSEYTRPRTEEKE